MDKTSRGLVFGDSINSLQSSNYWSTVQHSAQLEGTTLDSASYSSFSVPNTKALKRKWGTMAGAEGTGNPLLTLGLGHSQSSSDNSKVSSATACEMSPSSLRETDEESSVDLSLNFDLSLGYDGAHFQKKSSTGLVASSPKLDLQLSLSTGPPVSAVTYTNMVSPDIPVTNSLPATIPSNWGFEHSVVSSSYASEATYAFPCLKIPRKEHCTLSSPVISSPMLTSVKSPGGCTSVVTNPQQRSMNTKTCQFPGCGKGARGASGHCIAHGGGRRCQKPGCQKGAEGRTIYCKAHGGGRRCEFLGCTKSAEGRTDHCIAHGGGRRCSNDGCSRAARGRSGLCIRHGGGKRCQKENCTKSAEGHSGLCISHGGGRRCQFPDCAKGAQGSTKFCKAHGGGKRCTFLGCTKGAEGSTPYCKGHGGGKRCLFEGGGVCPKSVPEGGQSTVCAMEVARDAGLRAVRRVRRGALISARHTGEANAAHGACQTQAMVLTQSSVISLLAARPVSVQLIVL